MVQRLLISMLPFTEAMRLIPGTFARANFPLHLVMTTGETAASTAASARLAGPWRRTMYELYDWVSPVGTEGNVQDEQVERATLVQQPCLGVALSSVAEGAAWPRDDFLTGATLEFSFGPPPVGPLVRPALTLDEIPYADAGVGHTVWGSAMVLALFLRCPAGLALLIGASSAEGGEGGGAPKPRVLEIGAGLGLPGRDLAARGVAALVTLTDSRTKLVEQLARAEHATGRAQGAAASDGCPVQAVSMNWNAAEEVAEVAAAKYDLCIASDVAYYSPDVAPLAAALRAVGATTSVIVAPMHREAAAALSDALLALGCSIAQQQLSLVSSDADGWVANGGEGGHDGVVELHAPLADRMPALAYRVLVVTWPGAES